MKFLFSDSAFALLMVTAMVMLPVGSVAMLVLLAISGVSP